MKRISLIFCAAALAVASAVPALAENIVFQQAPSVTHASEDFYSENVMGNMPANYTVYDNFSLVNDTTLGSIEWNGLVVSGSPAVSAFTVTVSSNNGGQPGLPLYSQTAGNVITNSGALVMAGNGLYNINTYSMNFGFQGLANTQYWLSIVATDQDYGDWGWQVSEANDLHSLQYDYANNFAGDPGYDMTFTLYDNFGDGGTPITPPAATPEPGSLMLTGTGLLSLAGAVRRRFTRN